VHGRTLNPLTDLVRSDCSSSVRPFSMLQKLFSIAVGFAVLGHLFFRPQLKQLGQRIDRFVSVMATVVFLTWAGQLIYLLLSRR
jgi:hypothetical protein